MHTYLRKLCAVALSGVLLAGCGSSGPSREGAERFIARTYNVKGVVSCVDKPNEHGTFVCQWGRLGWAEIRASDGGARYQIWRDV